MSSDKKIEKLASNMYLDNEIGSTNKPPRLQSVADYHNWVLRYKAFLKFTDHELWNSIERGPYVPIDPDTKEPLAVQHFGKEDKLMIEKDNKSWAALTMALPHDILINFEHLETAKELWNALKDRYEGDEEMREARKTHVKQQFTDFKPKPGESVEDIVKRYSKLMYEAKNAGVTYSNNDTNRRLLDSMPPEWSVNSIIIKRTEKLNDISLEKLIHKILSIDLEDRQAKARHSGSTMPSPVTALVANSKDKSQAKDTSDITASIHQSLFSATKESSGELTSENLKATEEYLKLFNTFMGCYNAFLAGKIGPGTVQVDDLTQVNPDDIEEMDIKWTMALAVYRAKQFQKKTGREIKVDGVVGFDKSQSRCYNCQQLGHFARDCNAPKANSENRKKTEAGSSGSEKALVATKDNVYDWGQTIKEMELKFNNQAFMAEISDPPPSTSSSDVLIKHVKQ